MARMKVKCKCGWVFEVGDAVLAKGELMCPSCGVPLRIKSSTGAPSPASVPPPVREAPDESPVGQSGRRLYLVLGLCGAAVALTLGVIIIIALSAGSGEPGDGGTERRSDAARYEAPQKETIKWGHQPGKAPAPSERTETRPSAPPPPLPTLDKPLPAELIKEVRERLAPLPRFYQALFLSGEEQTRLERLARSGLGRQDDAEFLRRILKHETLAMAREEAAEIQKALAETEMAAMSELPQDLLVLTSGTSLEGNVREEKPDGSIKWEGRSPGGTFTNTYTKAQYKELQKGKGSGGEFRTRWEFVRSGPVEEKVRLLTWSKEKGMHTPSRLVAYLILASDPGHETARGQVGLPGNPVEAKKIADSEGGILVHQGIKATAKRLKEKLLKEGYVIFDGQWFAPKQKIISVPGLDRYSRQGERTLSITPSAGVALVEECEVSFEGPGNGQEREVKKPLRWFYAPVMEVGSDEGKPQEKRDNRGQTTQLIRTRIDKGRPPEGAMMEGEITLHAVVGARVIDGSIITTAESKGRSSIVVYFNKDGERVKLYQAATKEGGSHALPDGVRGRTELQFVVTISTAASYDGKRETRMLQRGQMNAQRTVIAPDILVEHRRLIPQYDAVLFPSTTNTIEVFRLRLNVAEPAEGLNKLFSSSRAAQELLKQP